MNLQSAGDLAVGEADGTGGIVDNLLLRATDSLRLSGQTTGFQMRHRCSSRMSTSRARPRLRVRATSEAPANLTVEGHRGQT